VRRDLRPLIAVLIVGLLGCGLGMYATPRGWMRSGGMYSNPELGLVISVPPDWKVASDLTLAEIERQAEGATSDIMRGRVDAKELDAGLATLRTVFAVIQQGSGARSGAAATILACDWSALPQAPTVAEIVAGFGRSYRIVEPPRRVVLGGREATRVGVAAPGEGGLENHSVIFLVLAGRSGFLLSAGAEDRARLPAAEAVLQTVRFQP
jgi:hypothetical protein